MGIMSSHTKGIKLSFGRAELFSSCQISHNVNTPVLLYIYCNYYGSNIDNFQLKLYVDIFIIFVQI